MDQAEIHASLSQQKASADALLNLLRQESDVVLQGDVEALERLTADKKRRCEQLDGLGEQLKAWLLNRSLEQWLSRQSEPVQERWEELSATLGECRRQNDANGLLITQRQQEIEQKLRPADSGTYGAAGQALPQQGNALNFHA